MPPKKRAADSANPEPTLSKVSAEETAGTEKSAAVRKRTHPTTAAMVREALKDLDSRKGVSSQAIQSFIKQKYPSADGVRLKYLIRTALKRGMETGTLVRPVNPSVTSGALRKFRLAPEKQPKAKTENTNPNVQKAPKAAKDGVKKTEKAGKNNLTKLYSFFFFFQDIKLSMKPKKAGESAPLKVVPAKKPKAKQSSEGNSDSTKSQATKVTKDAKTGKAAQSKAAEAHDDAPAPKQLIKLNADNFNLFFREILPNVKLGKCQYLNSDHQALIYFVYMLFCSCRQNL
uniref:H15 domain-containing protein n=1 Tax=Nothobranchius furzeri TaxID=105023 RepID=A0A8C6L2W6_NOTFU